jgi:hypothetical protein
MNPEAINALAMTLCGSTALGRLNHAEAVTVVEKLLALLPAQAAPAVPALPAPVAA